MVKAKQTLSKIMQRLGERFTEEELRKAISEATGCEDEGCQDTWVKALPLKVNISNELAGYVREKKPTTEVEIRKALEELGIKDDTVQALLIDALVEDCMVRREDIAGMVVYTV